MTNVLKGYSNKENNAGAPVLPPEIAALLGMETEVDEHAKRANKWVKNYGVQHRLKMFAKNTDINRPKKRLNVQVAAGGGSYTDGKLVRVALPEDWFEKDEKDYVRFMKFVTAHEMGHINWSDFDIFKNFQMRVGSHFEKKFGIKQAASFGGNMLNITEDGRIERAQVNVMPGLLKYVRYINGTRYEEFKPNNLGIVPLQDFTNTCLMLSKTGLLPKGFEERCGGTETDVAIKKAMPHIVRAIRATTAKECADATWDLIVENDEFLAEAMKPFEIDEDKLKEMLEEDMSGGDGEGGEGNSAPNVSDDTQSGEGGSGDSGDAQDGSEENSDDSGSDGNSKERDSEGDSEDKSEGGSGSDSEEEKESESKKGKEQGKGKVSKKVRIEPLGAMNGEADYSNRPSQRKAPQGSQSAHFGDEDEMEKGNAESKSLVKGEGDEKEGELGALDELIVLTEDESIEFLDKAKDEAKRENQRIARETVEREQTEVTQKEINGVLSEYARNMDFKYMEEQFEDNGSIPAEITTRARGLRRDLKEIFLDKSGWTLMNQRSGMLDETQLYRAGSAMRQTDVFIKKHMPEDTNWVVSVLVDNSGSMNGGVEDENGRYLGTKTTVARHATATIEMALNGLVPLKIARFDVAWAGGHSVRHARVRGWEQKTKDTLSWNSTDRAGGGNADAMSIGVAVEELKNRPESKKLLLVMSDGLPAENTPQQVKRVVEEARKDGIKVVGIGFGPERELERNADTYRDMYGKDIVLTMPGGLTKELVKILRQTIARG